MQGGDWGFPGSAVGKNPPDSAGNAGDVGSVSGSGRSPGGGHGNPLQYSCPGEAHGQRSLAAYSPWDRKRLGHDSTHTSRWLEFFGIMEFLFGVNKLWTFPSGEESNHLVKDPQTRLVKGFPNFLNSWRPLMFQPFFFKVHPVQRSQSRDKYCVILLICGIQAKYNTNELIYKTEIDPQTQKTNIISKGGMKG